VRLRGELHPQHNPLAPIARPPSKTSGMATIVGPGGDLLQPSPGPKASGISARAGRQAQRLIQNTNLMPSVCPTIVGEPGESQQLTMLHRYGIHFAVLMPVEIPNRSGRGTAWSSSSTSPTNCGAECLWSN